MNTWTCEQCGKTFQRPRNRVYRFCGHSCSALALKPSQHLYIESEHDMSLRTKYRRRAARGETQAVFRYPFNENFFLNWSDDLAWLIGVIWTDGYLFPAGNSVEICSKDRVLIEDIAALIGQENGVRPKNNGRAWRVLFTSDKVRAFLVSIGLETAKSTTVRWPTIPGRFEGHFFRGLVDGDGSVCLTQNRKGQQVPDLRVELTTASPGFAQDIAAWLTKNNMLFSMREKRASRSRNPLWSISIFRQSTLRRLYPMMYPSVNVPTLMRKRKNFDKWIGTPRVRSGRPAKKNTPC